MNNKTKIFAAILLIAFSCGTFVFAGSSEEIVSKSGREEIFLLRGDIATVEVDGLSRVAVADELVVDLHDANESELTIIGIDTGQTAVFVWDISGKRTINVYVYEKSPDIVKDRLRELLDGLGMSHLQLRENPKSGKVIINGYVNEEDRDQYDMALEDFLENVIDLTEEEKKEDLIEINVQVTELTTTLFKSLGFNWGSGESSGLVLTYEENFPSDLTDTPADYFKIGDFTRTNRIQTAVNALITEGKAKVLSQPRLLVVSGDEASFLVGGEVPIKTTTISAEGATENVEFKEFGISMNITPTIRNNEKIDITLNVEISDIDSSTPIGGDSDVAFVTRSVQTRLMLDDGQPIVMAGLIRSSRAESVQRIPYFSKIPILGAIFRNKSTPAADQDQEIVISLTPNRIKENKKKEDVVRKADLKGVENSEDKVQFIYSGKKKASSADSEVGKYVQGIQRKLSKIIVYPPEAKQYGWEGTVKVNLHILNDGRLAFASVEKSSGYRIFDDYAMNSVKQAAPYVGFPSKSNLQELSVTIPIVYSLGSNF